MKICFFYELFYPNVGGLETHIFEVARELVKRGHKVEVFTAGYPNTKKLEYIDGIKIVRYNPLGLFSWMQKSKIPLMRMARRFLYAIFGGLHKRFSKEKYDILHGHVQSGLIAARIARNGKSKVIWTWHGTYLEWWHKLESWFLATFMIWFEKFCAKHIFYDHMITADQYTKDLSITKLGLKDKRITAIPNAIRLESFNPKLYNSQKTRQNLKLKKDDLVLFTARRLVIKTGIQYLVDALPEIIKKSKRNIKLVIAGDGPLRKLIEDKSKKLKVFDNIIFLGNVAHKQIPELYNMCDIVVIPSLIEATTITGIEAMAMEKPTIGTNSGGTKEVILHNKTGIIINPESSKEISNSVLYLIKNLKIAEKLGKNARKLVLEKLTWIKNVDAIEKVYKEELK